MAITRCSMHMHSISLRLSLYECKELPNYGRDPESLAFKGDCEP